MSSWLFISSLSQTLDHPLTLRELVLDAIWRPSTAPSLCLSLTNFSDSPFSALSFLQLALYRLLALSKLVSLRLILPQSLRCKLANILLSLLAETYHSNRQDYPTYTYIDSQSTNQKQHVYRHCDGEYAITDVYLCMHGWLRAPVWVYSLVCAYVCILYENVSIAQHHKQQ